MNTLILYRMSAEAGENQFKLDFFSSSFFPPFTLYASALISLSLWNLTVVFICGRFYIQ